VPSLPCPACGKATPRLLEENNEDARANYYRCDCGHIWSIHKQTGKLIAHVTPLTRTPRSNG